MTVKTLFALLMGVLAFVLVAGCQPISPAATATASEFAIATAGEIIEPTGFTQRIHDPVIANEGDTYYVYSTGARIPFICSTDMISWEFCGRVLEQYPAWTREVNPDLGDAWAPDISFFNHRWHLYYAVSSFGSQDSAIGLQTNHTFDPQSPDYAWVDEGVVLRSRPGDQWNAIDPALVLDEAGEPWLAWGSFWQGIWMRKIDAETGMFALSDEAVYHLADRSMVPGSNGAIEAAFIVPRGGMWYLFASFDQCCQGAASTYNVRVGRSEKITGPYLDRDGVPMTEGGGTRVLDAYEQWKGPGHNGMLIAEGTYWMVYHAYHAQLNGISFLRIESVGWTADGWPVMPSQSSAPK